MFKAESESSFSLSHNSFEYAFVVPSTLAGFDRTPYGRVSHRIQATLVGQPQSTSRFGSLFASPSRTRSPSPNTHHSNGHGNGGGDGGGSGGIILKLRSRSGNNRGDRTPPLHPINNVMSPSHFAPPVNGTPSLPPSTNAAAAATKGPPLSRQSSALNLPSSFSDMGSYETNSRSKWEGTSWLSGNLETSKEMWVIPLPSENREAIPLDRRVRSLVEGLGIVPWSLQTDAITVGGILVFQSALTDVNPRASLWAIRLSISQRISLKSPRRPQEPETQFPATNLVLFEKGRLPGRENEWYTSKGQKGTEPIWEGDQVPGPESKKDRTAVGVSEVLRMPDENRLRPSTCPG